MATTATLPNWATYGNYASENYGAHALVFSIGDIDIYYSYKTPVAFRAPSTAHRLVVRENTWGPTTGKHLNAIDGGTKEAKRARISGSDFESQLSALMETVSA